MNPTDFRSENDWAIRLELEASRSIKLPSVEYQLVGNKMFQKKFSEEKVLRKYLNIENTLKLLPTMCSQTDMTDWTNPKIRAKGFL